MFKLNKIMAVIVLVCFVFTNITYAVPDTYTLRSSAVFCTEVASTLGGDLKKSSSAGVLNQEELARIYNAQESDNWLEVQAAQQKLKGAFLEGYRKSWEKVKLDYPNLKPPFDMSNSDGQEFEFTPETAAAFNITPADENGNPTGHNKEFIAKSDNSTAGIRTFYDLLFSHNPNVMYNDAFITILVQAEAEFLTDAQKKLTKHLPEKKDTKKFDKFIAQIRKDMKSEDIKIIEEIYGMSLENLIIFLKGNIVKLVGGEVRAHSAKFVEMESRILAANGITVLTAENYSDSVPIYMFSFLTYLLGASGATNNTPSHSSNYVFGRKALGPGGGQLLPDEYEKYRQTITDIIERRIYKEGSFKVRLAAANDSNIKNTLTYKRMTKLYSAIVNITPEQVELINEATEKGHKITLNCLNGSTWKTLKPLLEEMEINLDAFELVMEDEDSYFNVGYIVTYNKETGVYDIDHLGVDTTMTIVANTIPYSSFLDEAEIGRRQYELDPDSDRFCLKQVLEDNKENRTLLEEYGIDFYTLRNGNLLIAPSPNKVFLNLDIADYERMVEAGTWDQFQSLYMITYVSSRAWAEFADAIDGLVRVMCRVGFKNLNEAQEVVQHWYNGTLSLAKVKEMYPFVSNVTDYEITFEDQLGRKVSLNKDKKIRIHSKQEESGGRIAGMDKPSYNVFGQMTLAMPEKSAADSLLSELYHSSQLFLQDQDRYSFLKYNDYAFKKYGMKSKIDGRIDILHGNQGVIAKMGFAQKEKALAAALANKTNFNNFFFSLGKAVKEGKITNEQVIEILNAVMPQLSDTWNGLEEISLAEEPLSGGRKRPSGVPLVFKSENGKIAMVTEFDFRPSGTDPLKSKLYYDAEINPDKKFIEEYFKAMTEYNLFEVLEYYGIESALKKPTSINSIGLKQLVIGKGPVSEISKPEEYEFSNRLFLTEAVLRVIKWLGDIESIDSHLVYQPPRFKNALVDFRFDEKEEDEKNSRIIIPCTFYSGKRSGKYRISVDPTIDPHQKGIKLDEFISITRVDKEFSAVKPAAEEALKFTMFTKEEILKGKKFHNLEEFLEGIQLDKPRKSFKKIFEELKKRCGGYTVSPGEVPQSGFELLLYVMHGLRRNIAEHAYKEDFKEHPDGDFFLVLELIEKGSRKGVKVTAVNEGGSIDFESVLDGKTISCEIGDYPPDDVQVKGTFLLSLADIAKSYKGIELVVESKFRGTRVSYGKKEEFKSDAWDANKVSVTILEDSTREKARTEQHIKALGIASDGQSKPVLIRNKLRALLVMGLIMFILSVNIFADTNTYYPSGRVESTTLTTNDADGNLYYHFMDEDFDHNGNGSIDTNEHYGRIDIRVSATQDTYGAIGYTYGYWNSTNVYLRERSYYYADYSSPTNPLLSAKVKLHRYDTNGNIRIDDYYYNDTNNYIHAKVLSKADNTGTLYYHYLNDNLDLSSNTNFQVFLNLAWNDNSTNETGFKLERGLDGISFTNIMMIDSNIETYVDQNLAPNATYYYKLCAYNEAGSSYAPEPPLDADTVGFVDKQVLAEPDEEGAIAYAYQYYGNTNIIREKTCYANADYTTDPLNPVFTNVIRIKEYSLHGRLLSEVIDGQRHIYAGFADIGYAAIGEAIESAQSGDMVLVSEGTYNLNGMEINVKNGVRFYGGYNALMERDITGTPTVIVNGYLEVTDEITELTEINGLTIDNSLYSIKACIWTIGSSDKLEISNITLIGSKSNSCAIVATQGSRAVINNNEIRGINSVERGFYWCAILVHEGASPTIESNTIQHIYGTAITINGHGIPTGAYIQNNTFWNNGYNPVSKAHIFLYRGDGIDVVDNTFSNGNDGVVYVNCSNMRVINNTFSGLSGKTVSGIEEPLTESGNEQASVRNITPFGLAAIASLMVTTIFSRRKDRSSRSDLEDDTISKTSSAGEINLVVSIGGNKLAINLIDTEGQLLLDKSHEIKWTQVLGISPDMPDFWSRANSDRFVDKITEIMQQVLEDKNIDISIIGKIGIAFAGPVNSEAGIVGIPFKAPNTPFENYDIVEAIQQSINNRWGRKNMLIEVLNDSKAALIGEQSKKGSLYDIQHKRPMQGSIVIIGTGINIASGDERVKEVGHQLIPTNELPSIYTASKGAYTYVGFETKGDHPKDEQGRDFKGDFEDRVSGPNLAKKFARVLLQEENLIDIGAIRHEIALRISSDFALVKHFPDRHIAQPLELVLNEEGILNEYEESIKSRLVDIVLKSITATALKDNKLAQRWIKDTGEEIGRALSAFIATYKNEGFVEHIVLVSGVNENLGKGVVDSEGHDIYVGAIREAVEKELHSSYRLEADRAREFAQGIVRSQLTYERELIAFTPDITKDSSVKSSLSGIKLSKLDNYTAETLLAKALLDYSPNDEIFVDQRHQAVVVYSDTLLQSRSLQRVIRSMETDTRRFYLVNKEDMSTEELLQKTGLTKEHFDNYIFEARDNTPDQITASIIVVLQHNKIEQVRIFAKSQEDLAAWSRQHIIEALVMLLTDKRLEIISDYSAQHEEWIRTREETLSQA